MLAGAGLQNRGERARIYWIPACAGMARGAGMTGRGVKTKRSGMTGKGRLSTGPNSGERLKRMGL